MIISRHVKWKFKENLHGVCVQVDKKSIKVDFQDDNKIWVV